MKTDNKRTVKQDFLLIKRAVKLVNETTPHFTFHCAFFAFCGTLTRVGSNYITASIVDELTGDRRIKILILLLSCYLIEILLRVIRDYSWRRVRTFNIIAPKWEEMLLNNKSFETDYRNTEDAKVRAMRQMITDRAGKSGFNVLMEQLICFFEGLFLLLMSSGIALGMFFKSSPNTLYGAEKFIDSPLMTLAFFAVIAALSVFDYKKSLKYTRRIVETQKRRALFQIPLHYYLNDYADDSKAGKDIHIFNQRGLIRFSVNRFYKEWEDCSRAWYRDERKNSNLHNITYILSTGITYLYVALKVYIGAFKLGGFLKYQFCIARITESCGILSGSISELRANNDYLELFFSYLDMPSEMHYGTIPTEKRSDNVYDIEFHDVGFKYPGSDTYAIRNLSFRFRVGEKIAVVGRNGSGKTTMIKLFCRLYDPTEGYITLNGIDITKYDYEDYMALFSVVFQDFRLFSFSLGENVACKKDFDSERVLACLATAGMGERVSALANGLDSIMYKDFDDDGIEISGGEAQKIAIARALYKDAPFVILDEPTASLDPLAEYEIYSRFNDMVKNKTAVYISHRLSSCRFCDKIAVFDDGQVIQFGSHEELLADENGKYFELWNAQAQYYVNS